MVRKGLVRLNKYQIPFIKRMFLRDKVLVCNEISKVEIVLGRNCKYFINNIYLLVVGSLCFMIKYKRLKREYRMFFKKLGTDSFWQDIFSK